MKEQTEHAVVEMFNKMATQHLKRSPAKRLQRKEIMQKICARFSYSRSRAYEILKRRGALGWTK